MVVKDRLGLAGIPDADVRCDLIGVDALHGSTLPARAASPYEVRLRVAARTPNFEGASRVGHEVEALYTNGPAGGGGVTKSTREVLTVATTFLPRSLVPCRVNREVV